MGSTRLPLVLVRVLVVAKFQSNFLDEGHKVEARLVHLISFAEKNSDIAVERRVFEWQGNKSLISNFIAHRMGREQSKMIGAGDQRFEQRHRSADRQLLRMLHLHGLYDILKHRVLAPRRWADPRIFHQLFPSELRGRAQGVIWTGYDA